MKRLLVCIAALLGASCAGARKSASATQLDQLIRPCTTSEKEAHAALLMLPQKPPPADLAETFQEPNFARALLICMRVSREVPEGELVELYRLETDGHISDACAANRTIPPSNAQCIVGLVGRTRFRPRPEPIWFPYTVTIRY